MNAPPVAPNALLGAWGMGYGASLLASTAIEETVQTKNERELDRRVQGSADERAADYNTYVILPLFLLMGAMIAVRKVITF